MAPQRQSSMRQRLDQGRDSALRRPLILVAIGVAATLILAMAVVFALLRLGSVKALSDNAALIGALVALGGVFTAQLVSISLDNRRSQESRELETQRAHEAALQTYLEQVGKLLIDHPLRDARPGDNLSTVARAQTLAVLEGLDPQRKGIVIKFLYESGLIDRDAPVISLALANLRGVDLNGTVLAEANFSMARLDEATMSDAYLPGANLSGAEFTRADLSKAFLAEADLRGTILQEANLRGASLWDADLSTSDGSEMDIVPGINILKEAWLKLADQDETILAYATELHGADLSAAYLGGADLSGAVGITTEVLEEQAKNLTDTTMPDGSKHS